MPTLVTAGARLDRLTIGSFHHRIFWLVGASAAYQLPGVIGLLIALMLVQIAAVWAWGVELRKRALEDMLAAQPA